MTMPKAYEPQQGYKYQILVRFGNESYEHCDYAKDKIDKNFLVKEYRLAYGAQYAFKSIMLPRKYWSEQ